MKSRETMAIEEEAEEEEPAIEADLVRCGGGGAVKHFFAFTGCALLPAGFMGQIGLAILGGIVLLISICSGSPSWICGNCGNEVSPTSRLCPDCRASLARRLSAGRFLVNLAWFVFFAAAVLGLIYCLHYQGPPR